MGMKKVWGLYLVIGNLIMANNMFYFLKYKPTVWSGLPFQISNDSIGLITLLLMLLMLLMEVFVDEQ